MKRADEIVVEDIPAKVAEIAMRRTRPIVSACVHESNVLRAIAISCYLQGAIDFSPRSASTDAARPEETQWRTLTR